MDDRFYRERRYAGPANDQPYVPCPEVLYLLVMLADGEPLPALLNRQLSLELSPPISAIDFPPAFQGVSRMCLRSACH